MNIQNPDRGQQVKTGEKFGIVGYWVTKNNQDPYPCIFIPNPQDGVPSSGGHRAVFIYFGKVKPSEQEIMQLRENSPEYP